MALEFEQLDYYIMGLWPYAVLLPNWGTGYKDTAIYLQIRAVYSLYIEQLDEDIVDKYVNAYINLIDKTKSCKFLQKFCLMCEDIIKCQKSYTIPFYIDCEKIIKHLKDNIKRNWDLFEDSPTSWEALKMYTEQFKERTGYSLLE